ncbi:hypothetical protein OG474_40000 [Kribbella sp. NBC_01505]|uniref:sigma factor-like helix-turn-helix DNA-binding protein n=1 Tax=Kribbella sp. NBC_01505 TaxID=2903580 RepID=UPI00386AAC67
MEQEFAAFVDGRFTDFQRLGYLLTGDWRVAEKLVYAAFAKVRRSAGWERAAQVALVRASLRWWRPPYVGDELLQSLSRRTRAMVVLRYYAELPDGDIAEIMGCSVAAVRTRFSRVPTGRTSRRPFHRLG